MSDDWQTVPGKNARKQLDNGWPAARQRSAAPPSRSQVTSSKNHAGSNHTQMQWGQAAAKLATSQAMMKPAASQASSNDIPESGHGQLDWQAIPTSADRYPSPAPSVQPYQRPLPDSRATSPAYSVASYASTAYSNASRSTIRAPVLTSSASESGNLSTSASESGRRSATATSRSRTTTTYRSTDISSAESDSADSEHSEEFVAAQIAAAPTPVQISAPVVDTSGWAKLLATDPRKPKVVRESAKAAADDQSELARQIQELDIGPSKRVYDLAPPPPLGAWTLKQNQVVSSGGHRDPRDLREPTQHYLSVAKQSTRALRHDEMAARRPKLVVLDLNNTLLSRTKATSAAARNAKIRPYLASLLEYLCGTEVVGGVLQRRFNVMVWSSAQPDNVRVMCDSIGLTSAMDSRAPLVVDVWARDSMDLTQEQYIGKFPTIKDLSKIWSSVRWTVPGSSVNEDGQPKQVTTEPWDQRDTILLDDSPGKTFLQPYNHLHIPSWKPSELSQHATAANDNCLLQVIGILSDLRNHTNVSSAIMSGSYNGLGKGDVSHAWKERGVKVCKGLDIAVKKDFDPLWSDRLLKKTYADHPLDAPNLYDTKTASNGVAPKTANACHQALCIIVAFYQSASAACLRYNTTPSLKHLDCPR